MDQLARAHGVLHCVEELANGLGVEVRIVGRPRAHLNVIGDVSLPYINLDPSTYFVVCSICTAIEEFSVDKFLLSPVFEHIVDPAWGLSWYAGPCEIMAKTADEARRFAAGQFTVAVLPDPALFDRCSPWLEGRLVAVEPVRAGIPSDGRNPA